MHRKTKAIHHEAMAARPTYPSVTLKLEVVSYIESEIVLGHDGKTIGHHVDAMINDAMEQHTELRTFIIDLTELNRK